MWLRAMCLFFFSFQTLPRPDADSKEEREAERGKRRRKKQVLTSELDFSGQRMDDEWINESRQEVGV